MTESAIDRTSRALDLIPFVTNNPGHSIAELAERFDTTPTQIFKDLEMLFMCGLPGYSHLELIDMELDESYVAINNPQNLDRPRKLSFQEITSLSLGLQSLLPLASDPELVTRINDLSTRLKSLLNSEDQTHLGAVSLELTAGSGPWGAILLQAARERCAVTIEYWSARTDEISIRRIFPDLIYNSGAHIYTKALCTLTGEIRHFRHDRIQSAAIDSQSVRPQVPVHTQQFDEVEAIRVLLARRNLFFVEAHGSIVKSTRTLSDSIEVIFEIADTTWLLRALCALPGRVEIIEPAPLREAYHARLDAILALYR